MANNAFSVAMCTYNGARFLREQLASIAAQTQLPAELVVCDDRSSDNTITLIEEFAHHAPFPVRIQINQQNLGPVKNFEQAIRLCTGDFIALADQDDVWVPEKIARLDEEFARVPKAGLVFSDAELIDENSAGLGKRLWQILDLRSAERKRLTNECALGDLLAGATVTGATMAFRTRFRKLVLPIPENLTLIHDGWIALLISAVSRISAIDEPLVKYRQHPNQQVGAVARTQVESGISEAVGRMNPYGDTLAIARSARERLSAHRTSFEAEKAISDLDNRIAHLQIRADLPKDRMQRMGKVVNELLARRYHHYSKGFKSAVKDLFVEVEQQPLETK